MFESIQSNDVTERCEIPLRNLVTATRHGPIPQASEPAGNDATCEPIHHPQDAADAAARPISPTPEGRGVEHTATPAWVTGYDLYQAARIRRAAAQAALIRRACAIVGEAVPRAWRRYLQRRKMHSLYDALYALDDRTLHDLGFHRCEILSVTAELTGQAERTRVLPRAPRP